MKIGIDARFVGPEGTGLGKYTEKLIEELLSIDRKNQYVIFLRENNWQYLKLNGNFTKVLADVNWYSLQEQLKLPEIFKRQKLDLLHVPHFNVPIFYSGKFIVTIHDLTHQKYSTTEATSRNKLTYQLKKIGYQKVISNAIKKSNKIISPSRFVKKEVEREFKIDSSKIFVTYEAAEEEYFIKREAPSKKPKSALLYVGNVYPHKNLEKLLEAMKLIKSANLQIVCPRDIFYQRIEELIQTSRLNERVKLKGYLKSDSLVDVFNNSTAYIFPSLSEGFGIPGLNAMASRLPVLASNISTLKEVYGDAALYFNPNNPQDIADKIEKVLKSKRVRENLIEQGNNQVKKYSWKKMAKETLKIYESQNN